MIRGRAIKRLLGVSSAALAATSVVAVGGGFAGAGAADAAPSACTANAGNSGLSAAVVAHSHQRIAHKTIDAKGCDIGIYVGAGASHVTISSVTVKGASFQGIFAEDTSYVTISHSKITGNAFGTVDASAPALPGSGLHSLVGQSFAVSLFGVSHSTVVDNAVYNNGRGGIGVMDNGPNDPGTITQNRSAAVVPSSHDSVVGNRAWKDYGGCAIVTATQNLGGRLSHILVAGNTVAATKTSSAAGPDVGGIVVAADLPGSSVVGVRVSGNKVSDSFEGGVIVNAEAPNSFTKHVRVIGNTVSGNNWGEQEAPKTAGIIVSANPKASVPAGASAPENIDTVVARNTVKNQFYGIWSVGNHSPSVAGNHIRVTKGGVSIVPAPQSHSHQDRRQHGGH